MASIIQGSGIGPASYVVTASDLHATTPGNSMDKYADDTYLIIPASNVESCASEIAHIEDCALNNNLRLNRTKVSGDSLRTTEEQASHRDSSASCSRFRARRVDQGTWSDDQQEILRRPAC